MPCTVKSTCLTSLMLVAAVGSPWVAAMGSEAAPTHRTDATISAPELADAAGAVTDAPIPHNVFPDAAIRTGSAGPIELGRTIEGITLPMSYRFVREEELMFFEGDEYMEVRYNLRRGERDSLRISVYQADDDAETHTISDILVLGGPFATAEGISVGSPLASFLEHYPSATIGYTYLMDSVVLEAKTEDLDRVLFILDLDDFTGRKEALECESDYCALNREDFRPASPIREIWIR